MQSSMVPARAGAGRPLKILTPTARRYTLHDAPGLLTGGYRLPCDPTSALRRLAMSWHDADAGEASLQGVFRQPCAPPVLPVCGTAAGGGSNGITSRASGRQRRSGRASLAWDVAQRLHRKICGNRAVCPREGAQGACLTGISDLLYAKTGSRLPHSFPKRNLFIA